MPINRPRIKRVREAIETRPRRAVRNTPIELTAMADAKPTASKQVRGPEGRAEACTCLVAKFSSNEPLSFRGVLVPSPPRFKVSSPAGR